MITNHLEALDECLNSPHISAEAKEHIQAIYDSMVKMRTSRKPTKQGAANAKMRQALEDKVQFGIGYTWADFANIIKAETGEEVSNRKALSIAYGIGIRDTGRKSSVDGKTTLWIRSNYGS